MPKRKVSDRSQTATVDSRRNKFKTPASRFVRDVATTVPRTRQQTLTQIDFVKYGAQVDDDTDLSYEEPIVTPLPKKRKIGRVNPTSCTVEPRSSKHSNIKAEENVVQKDDNQGPMRSRALRHSGIRVREIQDEQDENRNPAQTRSSKRLGIKSKEYRNEQDENKSPTRIHSPKRVRIKLEEVMDERDGIRRTIPTTNTYPANVPFTKPISSMIMPPPQTPRKSTFLENKVEIPSSQSPPVTPLSSRKGQRRSNQSASPLKELSTNLSSAYLNRTRRSGNRQVPRLEVRDTFDTSLSSEVGTEASGTRSTKPSSVTNPYNTRVEANTANLREERLSPAPNPIKSEVFDSDEEADEDLGVVDTTPRAPTAYKPSDAGDTGHLARVITVKEEQEDEADQPTLPEPKDRHQVAYEPPTQLSSTTAGSDDTQIKDQPSSPPIPIFGFGSPPPQPTTNSQQASAQLNADLHRRVQPFIPALETDSQFENAWRPMLPDDLSHSHEVVDLTSSPRKAMHHAARGKPPELSSLSSPAGPRTPTRSRPRPSWDFQPLTESQMLPESVMGFRTPTPPSWSSSPESFEEEDEEEEVVETRRRR